MRKNKEPKRGVSSKMVAATVAFLAIQGVPKYVHAQREPVDNSRESELQKQDLFLKFANSRLAKQKLDVIALINGTPVLKSSDNKIYLMDAQTADIREVTMEEYNKLSYNKVTLVNKIYPIKDRMIKLDALKLSQKVREGEQALRNQVLLLGVDKDGHEIFQTARGQKFFFDAATGDMVDYIGHVALIK